MSRAKTLSKTPPKVAGPPPATTFFRNFISNKCIGVIPAELAHHSMTVRINQNENPCSIYYNESMVEQYSLMQED